MNPTLLELLMELMEAEAQKAVLPESLDASFRVLDLQTEIRLLNISLSAPVP